MGKHHYSHHHSSHRVESEEQHSLLPASAEKPQMRMGGGMIIYIVGGVLVLAAVAFGVTYLKGSPTSEEPKGFFSGIFSTMPAAPMFAAPRPAAPTPAAPKQKCRAEKFTTNCQDESGEIYSCDKYFYYAAPHEEEGQFSKTRTTVPGSFISCVQSDEGGCTDKIKMTSGTNGHTTFKNDIYQRDLRKVMYAEISPFAYRGGANDEEFNACAKLVPDHAWQSQTKVPSEPKEMECPATEFVSACGLSNDNCASSFTYDAPHREANCFGREGENGRVCGTGAEYAVPAQFVGCELRENQCLKKKREFTDMEGVHRSNSEPLVIGEKNTAELKSGEEHTLIARDFGGEGHYASDGKLFDACLALTPASFRCPLLGRFYGKYVEKCDDVDLSSCRDFFMYEVDSRGIKSFHKCKNGFKPGKYYGKTEACVKDPNAIEVPIYGRVVRQMADGPGREPPRRAFNACMELVPEELKK